MFIQLQKDVIINSVYSKMPELLLNFLGQYKLQAIIFLPIALNSKDRVNFS